MIMWPWPQMNCFSLFYFWFIFHMIAVIRYFLIFECSLVHGHQVWTGPTVHLYTTLGGNLTTHPSCPTIIRWHRTGILTVDNITTVLIKPTKAHMLSHIIHFYLKQTNTRKLTILKHTTRPTGCWFAYLNCTELVTLLLPWLYCTRVRWLYKCTQLISSQFGWTRQS